jgi:hypothetical protein
MMLTQGPWGPHLSGKQGPSGPSLSGKPRLDVGTKRASVVDRPGAGVFACPAKWKTPSRRMARAVSDTH